MMFKRMIAVLVCVIFNTLVGLPLFAHEGHNQAPGSVNAPHGGWVQATDDLYVERLVEGDRVRFFVTDHFYKPIPESNLTLKATAKFPKNAKRKNEEVSVLKDTKSYFVTVDAKKLHRYEIELQLNYKGSKELKTKKLLFQIENMH